MNRKLIRNRPIGLFPIKILGLSLIIGSMVLLTACGAGTPVITTSASAAPDLTTETTSTTVAASGSLSAADVVLSLEGYGAIGAAADGNMSVYDMLTYAIQDEYLAHGEYEKIIEAFGSIRPYENIIKSEASHISYLTDIYASYGLSVPADDSAGHLVVPSDLLEAAQTGVRAEIDNIAMYDAFLSHKLPQDIVDVFEALRDASKSHLAAFEKQVDKLS